jgi:hypothetical protein
MRRVAPGVARVMMTTGAWVWAAVLSSAVTAACQQRPQPLGDWKVEYSVSGGFAFNRHYVTVTRGGELAAGDIRLHDAVVVRAPETLLAKLGTLLNSARPAAKVEKPPIADAIYVTLVLTSSGRTYELALTPEFRAVLDEAWDMALTQALVGAWRQSMWRLCNPVEQLTASDVDPAIDELTFRADGTFSIGWAPDDGHSTAPVKTRDYRGRYTIVPTRGSLRIGIDDSSPRAADFSGEGTWAIDKGQLTVTNVWFGTRQARQKPDICELTFVKK